MSAVIQQQAVDYYQHLKLKDQKQKKEFNARSLVPPPEFNVPDILKIQDLPIS